MTAVLTWERRFEIGIESIDLQHHYFVDLINRMSDELETIDDHAYLAAALDELSQYARFHFTSEENLMWRIGYPDIAEHRMHHSRLIDTLSGRISLFAAGAIAADAVVAFLVDWFVHHTVHEDRRIGVYHRLASRRDGAPAAADAAGE